MRLGQTHWYSSVILMMMILFLLLLHHAFYSEINTLGQMLLCIMYLLICPHTIDIFFMQRFFLTFDYCIKILTKICTCPP